MKWLLIPILFLIGCKGDTRYYDGRSINIMCIDGVQYYKIFRGAAIAYNNDGSIKLCKEEN